MSIHCFVSLYFCGYVHMCLCGFLHFHISTFPRRPKKKTRSRLVNGYERRSMALKTRQHHSAAVDCASFPHCASFPNVSACHALSSRTVQ